MATYLMDAHIKPAGSSEIQMRFETITPTRAREILLKNAANRPISRQTVATYTEEMRMGNWRRSSQGLAFSKDGKLLDGQHRLLAVIASGVTVETMVTYGLDKEVQQVIDKGRVRALRQDLVMRGDVTNAGTHAAVLRYLVGLVHNGETPKAGFGTRIHLKTIGAYDRVYPIFQKEMDAVLPLCLTGSQSKMKNSLLIAVMSLAYRMNPTAIEEMIESVSTGENMTSDDPAYKLRDMIIINRNFGFMLRQPDMLCKVASCIIGHVEGRKIGKLMGSELAYRDILRTWAKERQLLAELMFGDESHDAVTAAIRNAQADGLIPQNRNREPVVV